MHHLGANPISRCILPAAITLLAGCGGGGRSSTPALLSPLTSPAPTAKPTATPTAAPTATPLPQRLYVSTIDTGVAAYVGYLMAPFTAASTETMAITLPSTASVAALLVGPSGNVIVSNTYSGTVASYARPTPTTSQQFLLVANAYGIAFDGSGTFYAAIGNTDQIAMAPSPLSALASLTPLGASGTENPWSIAFDGAENMYVTNYTSGEIDAYAPPYNGAPFATVSTPSSGVESTVSYDAATNQLIAALNTSALVYNLPLTNASTPSATIVGPSGRYFAVGAEAVDKNGNLYVGCTNSAGPTIDVFQPPFANSSVPSLVIPIPYQATALAFGT